MSDRGRSREEQPWRTSWPERGQWCCARCGLHNVVRYKTDGGYEFVKRCACEPLNTWFRVPKTLATRQRARQLRAEASAAGCDVLDFSATEFLSATAADELVCRGDWAATTGESPEVRAVVERVMARRRARIEEEN